MQKSSDAFGRLRVATQSLETLRDDLSAALVFGRANNDSPATDRARIADLHRRVSSALSALCGEVRER